MKNEFKICSAKNKKSSQKKTDIVERMMRIEMNFFRKVIHLVEDKIHYYTVHYYIVEVFEFRSYSSMIDQFSIVVINFRRSKYHRTVNNHVWRVYRYPRRVHVEVSTKPMNDYE